MTSLTAAVFLAVAFVAGLAAVLVRLPPLVGFLIAGFALSAAEVDELPWLDQVADLGVTLLLFGIGLKLDLRSLIRREVWLTNGSHMLISTGLAMGFLGLLSVFGFTLLDEASWGTLALVGFALSFSSTVFVVRVLEERSDATAMYGRVAIGVLIMQDLAAVIFLTVSKGEPPSIWALGLVLLLPLAWGMHRAWNRIGHGEMQVLFGVLAALVPGYYLFDYVGLKGDLGALVMGVLLAPHARSMELSKDLLNLKELLLVGFFLSIGLNGGVPSGEQLALAALLLLMLPLQSLLYVGLLWAMRLRHRTSVLTSLVMFNYSEFGLIVITTGAATGLVDQDWLVVIAVAVAASFVISAAINRRGLFLANGWAAKLPAQDPEKLHPQDRPIDVGDARALVMGMGRVGRAAFLRFRDEYGLNVLGIEHDARRVAELREAGLNVLQADATDRDFWERMSNGHTVRVAVLAMPFHTSNIDALEMLRSTGFDGSVAAVAQYDADVEELERLGADPVFHLYGSAGTALADATAYPTGSTPG